MGHALLTDAIAARFRYPGSSAEFARRTGVSRSHLLGIVNGNARIGPKAAARILAAIREDELALADKIERELMNHWLHAKVFDL